MDSKENIQRIIDSGRFTERGSFLEKNPNEILHKDCTDVVVYHDGSYLQLLGTGEFYLREGISSKSLDEVERMLFENNKN
jgi:hypothetical protein